ncbi:MFS transporter [Paraburkholderia phosphatilytica]|uniref:MFS transporter n=1 Tax=Paraburkholderia phosphatilytica TaxID=2282883 RepID=UPI000E555819|nr:MFS transporter [Paraburkholderia phosphatilytica]
MSLIRLRVFALFSLGYFVSYVFRGVNLGFAPFITRDLGLSAADLGLLTSLYFLGFAGAQVPAGVLLDHFGARRVTAAMLLFAAAGAWVFGAAHGIGAMMLGRLLVGIGVSVCLGGAFKALAQHFPTARLPFVNGLVMAVGGFGGVMVGSPLTWVLGFSGWRTVCVWLGVLTVAVSAALWVFGPKGAEQRGHATVTSQFKGTWHILSSAAFWKIASFSVVTQGVFYAMQSLWVGAWLRDVMHLAPRPAATLVSVLGFAMMAGSVGFGAAARSLEQRGVSLYAFCGIGMALYVVTQLLIMFHAPLPAALLWASYGFFGGTGILSYAIAARHFPPQMTGRVNTTLTLVIFLLIFGFQLGVGAIVSHWSPDADGHYPQAAHLTAWGILVALQIASAIWYVLPGRALERPEALRANPQV